MDQIINLFTEHYRLITIVILSIFLGIEVIARVPAVLHTPLMSGANAIHGVVIVGAIIVMGEAKEGDYLSLILGFLAVVLGTLNVVGGFVVTDRMLEMFNNKKKNQRVTFKLLSNKQKKILSQKTLNKITSHSSLMSRRSSQKKIIEQFVKLSINERQTGT